MSRLCRLKTASHGDDGKWAYEEIVKLRAELSALKAENESLKKDAELWRGYQKRKQDLLDRGFLRSPLRVDELDAMAQGTT